MSIRNKLAAFLIGLLICGPGLADGIGNYGPPVAADGSTAVTTASGQFNVNATSLPFFRKAVANAKIGIRSPIAIVGDSTNMGAGAGTSGTSNLNGAAQKAWPQLLHQFNGASPLSLSSNSWWGTQGYDSAAGIVLTSYDTRLAGQGANWTPNLTSLGGKVIRYATGAVNNWVYAPTYAFDSFTVYFLKNAGNGSMTANVDGGASLGTITTANASLVWASQTFTVTKGIHTINLVPNNDGQMFIGGIVAYDSTVPGLDVVQTAVYGATSATFTPAVNVYDAINTLKFLAPALTVINLTINDSNAGTALATYTANLQIIITAAKVSGDCLMMIGAPSNTAQATNGTLDQYVAAINALAILNGCAVVNLKTRWVSYAVTNPIFSYFDTLHPGVLGNQDEAQALYGALMRGLQGSFLLKRDLDPAVNDNDPVWLEKAA